MAYGVQQNGKQFVVVDGTASPNYGEIFYESLQFSADSKHVAYAAERGVSRFVVVDGKNGPDFEGILKDTLRMSWDGSRIAFAVRKGEKVVQIIDDKPGPEYDKLEAALFSENGQHVAYLAGTEAARFVVVDGKEQTDFEEIVKNTLVFSPDGGRVAYGALKNGKYRMVVDGTASGAYDGVGVPSFSPDGKHVTYRAGKSEQALVFVDGTEVPGYTGLVCEPVFRKDGVLEFMTAEKGILYRVTSKAFLPNP